MMDYGIVIVPLSAEEGGGYAAYLPDVPGCMSDGETPQEAALNVQDALMSVMDVCESHGQAVERPGDAAIRQRGEIDSMRRDLRVLASADKTPDLDRKLDALLVRLERIGMTWFEERRADAVLAAPAKTPKVA